MPIKDLLHHNHRTLGKAFEAQLKGLGDKYGFDVTYEGGGVGQNSGSIKLGIKLREVAGGISGAQADWNRWCGFYGLKPEDFGKVLISSGKRFKITGVRPNAHKNAIVADDERTGRSYVFPPYRVQQLLGR